MRRLSLVAALLGMLAAAAPGLARAHHWAAAPCGLPASLPLEVEFGEVSVPREIREGVFARVRPPLVVATSQDWLARDLRARGLLTVQWQMKIEAVLGFTTAPADPWTIDAAAARLAARAARETACPTPLVALNELQGSWLPSPWSPTNAQYRANALAFMRGLHARGAHPYLMVPTTPAVFTGSDEAASWWRQVAEVADIVLQVHFDGPHLWRQGPVAGSRLRRQKMRRVLDQFQAIGIPSQRLGLLHGFQSGRTYGGREGLALRKWLQVVKWETLSAKEVVAERAAAGAPLGSKWSWGWGNFPALSPPDGDKPLVACVFLWARDPAACDARSMAVDWDVPFDAGRARGRLALPPGVDCSVEAPRRAVATAAVERVAATRDPAGAAVPRDLARAALLQRAVFWAAAPQRPRDVLAAERWVVDTRFGGSVEAYAAALGAQGAGVDVARGILADQLLARRLPGWRRARLLGDALRTTTCLGDAVPDGRWADLTRALPSLRLPPGAVALRPRR